MYCDTHTHIYRFFSEDKLRMADFLQIKNEKIVRNSMRNDERSAKVKFWYFFLNWQNLTKDGPQS